MRRSFVTGFAILLPLALTFGVVFFIVNFLTQPFSGAARTLLSHYEIFNTGFGIFHPEHVIYYGSQILILVLLFLSTVLLGMLTRWFFVQSLINLGDALLHKIPLVNKVYKTARDVIQSIFIGQQESFKQVVMIPFPTEGVYSIGLVTRNAPQVCNDAVNQEMVAVFVPTTPNPTSGYLCVFPKERIHYLDIPVEDGIKFIISCGVIHPTTRNQATEMVKKFKESNE